MKLGIFAAIIAALAIAASPALKAQDMPGPGPQAKPARPTAKSSVLASKPATESWGRA